jgi:hypothetical protein
MADQGLSHSSTVAVKTCQDLPEGRSSIWILAIFARGRAPSEAHEYGYWCISFVNRQTHRSRPVPPREPWQGFQTLQSIVNDTQIKSLVTS